MWSTMSGKIITCLGSKSRYNNKAKIQAKTYIRFITQCSTCSRNDHNKTLFLNHIIICTTSSWTGFPPSIQKPLSWALQIRDSTTPSRKPNKHHSNLVLHSKFLGRRFKANNIHLINILKKYQLNMWWSTVRKGA